MDGDAHHVTLDKIEAKWNFLNAFIHAVHSFLRIGENDVGFLIKARHYTLSRALRMADMAEKGRRTTIDRPSWRMRSTRPGKR